MMWSVSVCVCFVVIPTMVSAKITDRRGPLNLSFSKMAVFNEEPCTSQGGVCLDTSECPEGKLAEKRGLCPEQQKRGVECCLAVGRSVKDCQGLGGVCRKDCPANISIKEAEDCNDQVCCALVQ
ncbi:U-scoloptoxin(19)-Tl1a isoform X2 [Macrosteles quadrilineatus]|uniref:U-scoloptoxin(19)-Tl1a isoform X2 n=1 Tax=Macrosteles quadrilineatus TaxID=74068 RepID=UPI0023E15B4C|nr:U-scoloptoxin(19)-Tl1a isoform X2 [Macrosteles quadrilineatus]